MAAPASKPPLLALVDELLAEQSRLQTPVAGASRAFDRAQCDTVAPRRFESLIPLSSPGFGEQYAFEVDLDSCTGCKACVSACHALNGLDDRETWRDTGLLLGGCGGAAPITQTITSACHHCEDPACLNGCPVLAYEKDPATGIVRHLDDQCIGCQYCVLKCPYDVPKYNERLGIVRKCDLCHQRLAVGEAPACAQACPTHAIRIVTVSLSVPGSPASGIESEIGNRKSPIPFPGPDPTYTRPTTRYVTARGFPAGARAADAAALRPQPPHWPLVFMLTLLPWAILLQSLLLFVSSPALSGTWLGGSLILPYYGKIALAARDILPLTLGALGLAAATFHLGQPLRAWRIFLGVRNSWFSREAVLFGSWLGMTTLAALLPHWPAWSFIAVGTGLLGLACSVMIYVDTRRRFWRPTFTAPRFFLGGALLAAATLAAVGPAEFLPYYGKIMVALLGLKIAFELAGLRGDSVAARLQRGPLVGVAFGRLTLGVMGGLAFAWSPLLALAPLLAGEIAERYLFFRVVDAPKMPGYATDAAEVRAP